MEVSRLVPFALAGLVLAACSTAPARREGGTGPEVRGKTARLDDDAAVRASLYRQYREWKGVRYRRGGISRAGVDCSGFVFLTFRDRFGLVLPRKTEGQAEEGRRIARKALKAGDLVFFKTGFFSRHVGIYVGERTFLHVSEQKGVTMSSLDSRYWARRYWMSRRLTPG